MFSKKKTIMGAKSIPVPPSDIIIRKGANNGSVILYINLITGLLLSTGIQDNSIRARIK
jgi:hypothetical protein